jgi:carotenoid cleavage dioxygenase-like enzyme
MIRLTAGRKCPVCPCPDCALGTSVSPRLPGAGNFLALFVPKTGANGEDDGYLLDLLMGDTDAALVIIDASTMQEVARLHLPQRVPFGVHACWLDTTMLETIAARATVTE